MDPVVPATSDAPSFVPAVPPTRDRAFFDRLDTVITDRFIEAVSAGDIPAAQAVDTAKDVCWRLTDTATPSQAISCLAELGDEYAFLIPVLKEFSDTVEEGEWDSWEPAGINARQVAAYQDEVTEFGETVSQPEEQPAPEADAPPSGEPSPAVTASSGTIAKEHAGTETPSGHATAEQSSEEQIMARLRQFIQTQS
jgi:hypothetical protein